MSQSWIWPAGEQGWNLGVPGLGLACWCAGWILRRQAGGQLWSWGWCVPSGRWGHFLGDPRPGAPTHQCIKLSPVVLWLVPVHWWVVLSPRVSGGRALWVLGLCLCAGVRRWVLGHLVDRDMSGVGCGLRES